MVNRYSLTNGKVRREMGDRWREMGDRWREMGDRWREMGDGDMGTGGEGVQNLILFDYLIKRNEHR